MLIPFALAFLWGRRVGSRSSLCDPGGSRFILLLGPVREMNVQVGGRKRYVIVVDMAEVAPRTTTRPGTVLVV